MTTPISTEELQTLARTTSDRLAIALDYLTASSGIPGAKPVTQDGKPTISVGQGGLEARVYRPTTEAQATRNLHFALANLEAHVDWDRRGRAEQARIDQEREENLRKAEAEAKRAAELAQARDRVQQARLKNGLDLFNKINGTRHLTWASSHVFSAVRREEWAKKAEEMAALQRQSNPYVSSIFADGGYRNNVARADDMYSTSFRL